MENATQPISNESGSRNTPKINYLPPISQTQRPNHGKQLYFSNNHRMYSTSCTRPVSSFERSLNASAREIAHRKRVSSVVAAYRRMIDREEKVACRVDEKKRQVLWIGHHIHDRGIAEAVMDARNDEWREKIAAGEDPIAARPKINKGMQLPREKPGKNRRKPVFFWGC